MTVHSGTDAPGGFIGDSGRATAHVDGGPLATQGMCYPADFPAAGAPDQPALIHLDTIVTFGQLDRQASSAAALLQRMGHGRGERVAYLGKNSAIYFAILIGAMRAGTVLVPLNWRCTAAELSFIIASAGARLIVCDREFADLARASSPDADVMSLEGGTGFAALVAAESPLASWAVEPDAPAVLMFTSGTTGKPKGVVITQRMFALARQAEIVSSDYADWHAGDVVLSPMPNFHMAACSWVQCSIMRGLTCVITDVPSATNIIELCRAYGVTHTFIVPTVVRAVVEELEADGTTLPTLRQIHYGAAPMDAALLERSMRVIGCGFLHHYGMTENAGTATRLPPPDHDLARPALLRSIGRPQPGMQLEIRRPDLAVCERGEPGEIWLRSDTIMPGYWERPDATAEAIVDGWYRTGDGGYLDDNGYLYLTDRIKDMIVSGAENVYPVEVEAVLRAHPLVADVAVFGQPDERWGEIVVAAVELKAGAALAEDELRAHARELLAGYKIPKRIIFDLPLPRTATGKLQRSAARAASLSR